MGTGEKVEAEGKKYTPEEISAKILMKLKKMLKVIQVKKLLKQLLLFLHTLMMPKDKQLKMLVKLPAQKQKELLMNQLLHLLLMDQTNKIKIKLFQFTIQVVVHLMYLSQKQVMVYLKLNLLQVIITQVEMTLIKL